MKNKIEYFELSDAWVFTSLFMYNTDFRKIDLTNIIGAGDMLNHSVFNLEELKVGLNKLEKSGLIEIKDNQIRITSLGLETITKSKKLRGGQFQRVDNTFKTINMLKVEISSSEFIEYEFLNQENFNIAYNNYRNN